MPPDSDSESRDSDAHGSRCPQRAHSVRRGLRRRLGQILADDDRILAGAAARGNADGLLPGSRARMQTDVRRLHEALHAAANAAAAYSPTSGGVGLVLELSEGHNPVPVHPLNPWLPAESHSSLR